MDVNEVIFVEEFMERAESGVPQSEHGALHVSASPQLDVIPEIFRRESLLLYGIGLGTRVSFLENPTESSMYLWVARTQDLHGFRE